MLVLVVVALFSACACPPALAQSQPDLTSLAQFIDAYRESKQYGSYVAAADLNRDGVVDSVDAELAVGDAFRGPGVAGANSVVLPSDGSVAITPTTGTEYSITGAVPTLKTGSIIVSGQGEGVLRKVTSVTPETGGVLVDTTDAGLTDAVERGSIDIAMPPQPDAPIVWDPEARPGALTASVHTESLGSGINLSDITLAASAGTNSSVRLTDSRLYFSPSVDVGARIDMSHLTDLYAVAKGSYDVDTTKMTYDMKAYIGLQSDFDISPAVLGPQAAPWSKTIFGPYQRQFADLSGLLVGTGEGISGTSRPTVALTADGLYLAPGGSTTLRWTSTDATSVVSSNFGATDVSGSVKVTPTTTYTITVEGTGGQASATATVYAGNDDSPTGLTTIANVSSSGQQAHGSSDNALWPSISADGATWPSCQMPPTSYLTTITPCSVPNRGRTSLSMTG